MPNYGSRLQDLWRPLGRYCHRLTSLTPRGRGGWWSTHIGRWSTWEVLTAELAAPARNSPSRCAAVGGEWMGYPAQKTSGQAADQGSSPLCVYLRLSGGSAALNEREHGLDVC